MQVKERSSSSINVDANAGLNAASRGGKARKKSSPRMDRLQDTVVGQKKNRQGSGSAARHGRASRAGAERNSFFRGPQNPRWRNEKGFFPDIGLAFDELKEEFYSEKSYSPFLLLLTLEFLLIFSGAAFLYSNSSFYMLQRHFIWLTLGFLFSFAVYFMPISIIVRYIPHFAVLALILNVLPQIPILQLANDGSPRWIRIGGLSFQVSETLRLMLVLYFARRISLDQHKRLQQSGARDRTILRDQESNILWRPLLYLLLACLLVISQKDYSTTVLLLVFASAMVVLVGSWSTLGIAVIFLFGMTAIAMLALQQKFRTNRVREWLEGSGDQINWVYDALREGGWFGRGLGQGSAKHLVPAEMTDFPLAAVGEETGLLGISLVMILFLIFTIVGFHLARQNRIPFVRYTTTGLVILVFMQALVNFAVSCGILPVTGQPLPFFSVGGSSTMTYLVIIGLINSLNRPSRNLRSESVVRPEVSNRYANRRFAR